MLLSPYHQQPSLPPITITLPHPIYQSFSLPKARRKNFRTISVIRSSASDAKTLPHSAIQRIAEKLRNLGFAEENPNSLSHRSFKAEPGANSPGEIFVPLPSDVPIQRVGHTIDTSWSTPTYPVPRPGSGTAISRYHDLKKEWKVEKKLERKNQEKVPTLAELTLAPAELRRLRALGLKLTKKLKIGKAGITEGIVNGIHERWRTSEVVKIVCEDISRMNMKRTHEVLEMKTAGLVVWRSGSKILLYRGANYQFPYFIPNQILTQDSSADSASEESSEDEGATKRRESKTDAESNGSTLNKKTNKQVLINGVGSPNKVRLQLPGEAQLVEEAESILDGLGPRFTDWWAYDPLPVDGDLLPAVLPEYRRPFRLLPYGINPKLTDDEMTTLRRLGRPLPCHFALSRNSKLQGLAIAIIKLWEKCEIAKIAVKRGAQNTNSEMMAEELKWLTGGTLISRDKDFIVLYRGKDFLPYAVSSAIEERRRQVMVMEKSSVDSNKPTEEEEDIKPQVVDGEGTEQEAEDTRDHISTPVIKPKQLKSPMAAIERTSLKLSMALEKKAKAEKLLAELESRESPQPLDADKEGITEDEKYMLRKVGLRMRPFLLLGRRGVFDGTIENMHLHWKYRELVKIICKERTAEAAQQVAETLEAESGGILVAVERVSKGYAIIVYRGKNYQRPLSLRPRTLLTKREALKRSVEAQRRESLKLHVLKLSNNIDFLNRELVKDNVTNEMQLDEETRKGRIHEETVNLSGECMKSRDELTVGYSSAQSVSSSDEEKPFEFKEKDGTKRKAEASAMDADDVSNKHLQLHQDDETGPGCFQKDDGICGDRRADISSSSQSSILEASSCYDKLVPNNNSGNRQALERSTAESKVSNRVNSEAVGNNLVNGARELSNRERLILRKQALKMKKRPPFAIGRSNVVAGLAKALREHFQKNSLAIVNVKGRAKGTSVQEVVSKLKEATGALMVSQEPSKVILYRGWGSEEMTASFYPNRNENKRVNATLQKRVEPPVSRELIEAIRLECGLS